MTFDEQLSRTADTLTNRLRDEIAQQVHALVDELAASARADRDHAAADARAAAENHAAQQLSLAVADAESRAYALGQGAGEQAGKASGLQEAEQVVGRLADAMRAMDAARSLTEILEILAVRSASEAHRAAVLLVRRDRVRGWRLLGFDPAPDSADVIEFPLDEASLLTDAAARNIVASADGGAPARAPHFAGSGWTESVCAPIALGGEAVALVYADRNDAGTPAWRHRIEMLTRHATRCLEAVVAFKAARMLTRPAGESVAAADGGTSAEDEAAARRYARLLVSEIRLYHEDAVAAGRRERDLAARLGGEIARARMLYEQRVTAPVRQRADYFQDELVRTLADGDAALLELRS